MIGSVFLGLALLGAAAPAQLPHGVLYEYYEAAQMCEAMGGMGELTIEPEFARLADLNGDGVSDVIVDHSGLSCSAGASLFASGSSGFTIKIYLGGQEGLEPAYESTVREWRLVDTSDGPALELVTAGGAECGAANRSESCSFQLSWYRDGFMEGPRRPAR
mgnify:CR=1 FL=1